MIINLFNQLGSAAGRPALLPAPVFPFDFLNPGNDLWSLAGGIPVIDFHFADLFGGRFYFPSSLCLLGTQRSNVAIHSRFHHTGLIVTLTRGALQMVFEQFSIDFQVVPHRDAVRQVRPPTRSGKILFESTHFEATA